MPHQHDATSGGAAFTSAQQQQQQDSGPSNQQVVGPSSFRLQQHALLRAHRHVNSLLESLDEDGVSESLRARRDQQEIRQKAGYLRLKPQLGGSGAVDGDQQQLHRCGGLQHWDAPAPATCSSQRPQAAYYIPAGGDQSSHAQVAAARREDPPEGLRHKPSCPPGQRPKTQPPQLQPPQLQRLQGSSESSMQAVTDSLMTSTSSSTSSAASRGVQKMARGAASDDDEQPATCSDAFTDDSTSESPLPLPQQQQTTIAIQLLNSTAEDQRQLSTKSTQRTLRAVPPLLEPNQPSSSSTSIVSSTAALNGSLTPMLPEFRLPAAMWAGAVAAAAGTAAVAPATAKSQLVKQQPIPKLPAGKGAKEKKLQQQLLRRHPPPPLAHCPSLHHRKTDASAPASTSAAHEHQVNQTNQATSTTTSTATSATETPMAACIRADASQLQATTVMASRRQHRHQHQHYQQLARRRQLRRREPRPTCAYLPSDSFSAVAGTAATTATGDDLLLVGPQSTAVAALRPRMQLQRPLISRSEPQPTILAVVAATSDAQQLEDRVDSLRPSQAHVAAQIPASSAACDVVPTWSLSALPLRCYQCCLTLVSGAALYHRVAASQLPPQPTLRRNLRQKAMVSVQPRRKTAKQQLDPLDDSASEVPMLLRHHRSDCHLMERLSVTARLLDARNCQDDDSAPTRSALMSRVFYPEELTMLVTCVNNDLGPSDDRASCNSSVDNIASVTGCRPSRPPGLLGSIKSAPWTLVQASFPTLRARMTSVSEFVRLAQSSSCFRKVATENEDERHFSDSDDTFDYSSEEYEYDDVYQDTDDIRGSDIVSTDSSSSEF